MIFNFTIEGNIAAEPRLGRTKNGHPVCAIRLLHNTRYRNAQGAWVEGRTVAVDVTCWRDLAERVAALHKGDTVIAELAEDLMIDTSGRYPTLTGTARTVAVSMRFHGATSHRHTPAPADAHHHEIGVTGGYATSQPTPEEIAEAQAAHMASVA